MLSPGLSVSAEQSRYCRAGADSREQGPTKGRETKPMQARASSKSKGQRASSYKGAKGKAPQVSSKGGRRLSPGPGTRALRILRAAAPGEDWVL